MLLRICNWIMLILLVEKLPESYLGIYDANLFTCLHISSTSAVSILLEMIQEIKVEKIPNFIQGVKVLQYIDFAYFIAERNRN